MPSYGKALAAQNYVRICAGGWIGIFWISKSLAQNFWYGRKL